MPAFIYHTAGSGASTWYAAMLLGRFQATPSPALTGRAEYYADKDQVIVKTGAPEGFQTLGASLTADVKIAPNALWRSEVRLFASENRIFPTKDAAKLSAQSGFFATSFSLSF